MSEIPKPTPGPEIPAANDPGQENHTGIGRGTFLKASGLVGAGTLLAGTGLYGLADYMGWLPPDATPAPSSDLLRFFEEESAVLAKTAVPDNRSFPLTANSTRTPGSTVFNTPAATQARATLEATAVATPTPEARRALWFGKIDFSISGYPGGNLNDRKIADWLASHSPLTEMYMKTVTGDILWVPFFHPVAWFPDIENTGLFKTKRNTAVAWQDSGGRTGLWAHSGRENGQGLTMWEVQKYIEEDSRGYRHTPEQADSVMREKLRGSIVSIAQNGRKQKARIVAAVRIPPDLIPKSEKHIMDMVPWLADNFPDSGFNRVLVKQDVLMPRFCSRILSGERERPGVPQYQQARIVLAMEPVA